MNMSELPVGTSDFKEMLETANGKFYVDKSLMIKDTLQDNSKTILILRPRRFGKTLNLSMLHYFFAKTVDGLPTKKIFNNLAISDYPDCMKLQGTFPVISLTFKDLKSSNISAFYDDLAENIQQTFEEHRYLLESNRLSSTEKNIINNYLHKTASLSEAKRFILNLTVYIYKATNKKPIILIDEYDTPIQQAYANKFYNELINFFGNLLGAALKDNKYLHKAILTGITRVSKESLFSGLNNLSIYSTLHKRYSQHFGFTSDEVAHFFKISNISPKQDVAAWYNGYKFGNTTIYNPWSISNCIKESGSLASYWVNTSGNELMRKLIVKSSNLHPQIATLLNGNTISTYIDEHVTYRNLFNNNSAIWSLLLATGYLTVVSSTLTGSKPLYELQIPNKEIEYLYREIIANWLSHNNLDWHRQLIDHLLSKDIVQFTDKISTMVYQVLSCHDVSKKSQESFYHGLTLGLLAGLADTHQIKSNRESGLGRYDIALFPKDGKLGFIIELKVATDDTLVANEAANALQQIQQLDYSTEMQQLNVQEVLQIGIGFSGKMLEISSRTQ